MFRLEPLIAPGWFDGHPLCRRDGRADNAPWSPRTLVDRRRKTGGGRDAAFGVHYGKRMPSCSIQLSGYRRRAHPRAQNATLGARHISLKRVRHSFNVAPACRKLGDRQRSCFGVASAWQSALGCTRAEWPVRLPVSARYRIADDRDTAASCLQAAPIGADCVGGRTASVSVLRRSVKQVCHRAIEPLSAIAKSGQSCHASKS